MAKTTVMTLKLNNLWLKRLDDILERQDFDRTPETRTELVSRLIEKGVIITAWQVNEEIDAGVRELSNQLFNSWIDDAGKLHLARTQQEKLGSWLHATTTGSRSLYRLPIDLVRVIQYMAGETDMSHHIIAFGLLQIGVCLAVYEGHEKKAVEKLLNTRIEHLGINQETGQVSFRFYDISIDFKNKIPMPVSVIKK